ncbi:MAG: hypothetical protein NUV61_00125 [Candidatus Azambacteria bacterium]|nr:hypothetical protein [Candidatus Azambacteria bacterium]
MVPKELLSVLQFMYQWGWMAAPVVLFFVWRGVWLKWVQKGYAEKAEWITLELKIPHGVERTPKVMEQVFGGLHAAHKPSINFKEKWWDGKHQLYISMEIAGIGGAIHFYVRTPREFQKIIESQIYAQYKDSEITEVTDYMTGLPLDIPNKTYDLFGMELMFTKDDAYPIRTYRFFEEPSTEKKYIDPLASLMEVLGELKQGEQIWLQYLIKPVGTEWQKKGQHLIDRLIGKKDAKGASSNVVEEVFQFFYDLVAAVALGEISQGSPEKKEEKPKPETMMMHLSPGMKDVIAALEESISKHGFEVVIRIVYIARREIFDRSNIAATFGSFKQFSTYNLNGFKPNSKVIPAINYVFKKKREYMRKRRLYMWARGREFTQIPAQKKMILNTEELATIYHVPSVVLEVPMLARIAAKKAEPPPHLPTL